MNHARWWRTAVSFLLCFLTAGVVCGEMTGELRAKIAAAAPGEPAARPAKARKLLVFTLCKGFVHASIPVGAEAMTILGGKTGAFETVVSDDIAMFEPERLSGFDAVCFMNTTGELFMPKDFDQLEPNVQKEILARDERLKRSLMDFVRGGGGVVGIHAATDCFYQWPAFGLMMGGYFSGHPWNEKVGVNNDDPGNPINAVFGGKGFDVADEIYQFRDPYSRERLRVLLSLDTEKTDMSKEGIQREDGDFAVAWVRRWGEGRVFYCSLGHRNEIFHNPAVLRHMLAGTQFALGDLDVDTTPGAFRK